MNKIFVYDPTSSDKQSAVRGIGRYLQILKENFANEFEFVSDLSSINYHPSSIFINPFLNFLQPPLTMRRVAKKQIAVIHDLIPLKYPSHFPPGIKGSIYILLNKLALKNYDLVITDSEASKKDIIDILRLPKEKIKVIYPCLPKVFIEKSQIINLKSQINRKSQIQNSKRLEFINSNLFGSCNLELSAFCLYVGDATWNKNLVALARAIKIANVNCVFVGKVFFNNETILNHPWNYELKQFFKETINNKRFIFAGFVPDSELIKLYEHALFNILPSSDEGFGFSWLESANFSCPSLLSDIPVLREISAGNAIYADPKNPTDIANKINQLNSDKNLRDKIGAEAKKRSGFFSREKFKREFMSII
ncbi:MAG: glycosyltransferase family 1 protein [Patescibacteria group bacterium]